MLYKILEPSEDSFLIKHITKIKLQNFCKKPMREEFSCSLIFQNANI